MPNFLIQPKKLKIIFYSPYPLLIELSVLIALVVIFIYINLLCFLLSKGKGEPSTILNFGDLLISKENLLPKGRNPLF